MYRKGAMLSVAGVLILSFDAPLIRLISVEGWTVVVWRSLLMTVAFALYALIDGPYRKRLFSLPGAGTLLAALLFGISSVSFVLAAKLIPVSSVLTIVATIPLAAALLSRIFLGERLQASLFLSIAAAVLGSALVVRGDWHLGDPAGYLFAAAIVFTVGGYLTVLRSPLKPHAPQALALSGLFAAGVGAVGGGLPYAPAADIPYLTALGLIVVPIAVALLSAGTRYISAADVGMIMVLELVFGVLWAWLFLGEGMTAVTMAGVVVVLSALVFRARVASRRPAKPAEQAL